MAKPKATRFIGVDYGMARLGIAVSDETKMIAMPLIVMPAEKKAERTVFKFLQELERHQKEKEYQVAAIVVGLPLLMSGKVGFLADEVKNFIDLLRKATEIPVIPWDERLTTVQAERSLRESSLTRKRRGAVCRYCSRRHYFARIISTSRTLKFIALLSSSM